MATTRRLALVVLSLLTACASPPLARPVEPFGPSSPSAPRLEAGEPARGAEVPAPQVDWTLGISRADALALARAQGPRLLASRRKLGVAEAALVTAGTYPWNPVVEVQSSQNKATQNGKDAQTSVRLTQAIETGGQLGRRVDLAATERDVTLAEYANEERVVRREVALAFAEHVYRTERLGLARASLDRAKQIQDVAEARVAAKDLSEAEANLVRLGHRQALVEVETATRERDVARLRLLSLLGEKARELKARSALFAADVALLGADKLETIALSNRPDLRAAELLIEKAERKGDLARADRWPTIALSVGWSRDVSQFDRPDIVDRDHNLIFGLTVPLPIFDRRQGPILEAAAEGEQATSAREALRAEVRRDVAVAANRVDLARARLAILDKDLLPLAEKSVELTREAYRVGKVGTLEVLRAQDELQKARLARLDALYDHDQAIVELSTAVAMPFPDEAR